MEPHGSVGYRERDRDRPRAIRRDELVRRPRCEEPPRPPRLDVRLGRRLDTARRLDERGAAARRERLDEAREAVERLRVELRTFEERIDVPTRDFVPLFLASFFFGVRAAASFVRLFDCALDRIDRRSFPYRRCLLFELTPLGISPSSVAVAWRKASVHPAGRTRIQGETTISKRAYDAQGLQVTNPCPPRAI
jgi:hypothetical protein